MRVHIPHPVAVHVRDHSVVVEVRTVPVASFIPHTKVAKSIIDAAVEADVPRPVTMVEAIPAAHISPVARRPQRTHVRRFNPAARDPVIPIRPPGPVARSPDIVRIGRRRLVIVRQRWRRFRRLLVRQAVIIDRRVLVIAFAVRLIARIGLPIVVSRRRSALLRVRPLDRRGRLLPVAVLFRLLLSLILRARLRQIRRRRIRPALRIHRFAAAPRNSRNQRPTQSGMYPRILHGRPSILIAAHLHHSRHASF